MELHGFITDMQGKYVEHALNRGIILPAEKRFASRHLSDNILRAGWMDEDSDTTNSGEYDYVNKEVRISPVFEPLFVSRNSVPLAGVTKLTTVAFHEIGHAFEYDHREPASPLMQTNGIGDNLCETINSMAEVMTAMSYFKSGEQSGVKGARLVMGRNTKGLKLEIQGERETWAHNVAFAEFYPELIQIIKSLGYDNPVPVIRAATVFNKNQLGDIPAEFDALYKSYSGDGNLRLKTKELVPLTPKDCRQFIEAINII